MPQGNHENKQPENLRKSKRVQEAINTGGQSEAGRWRGKEARQREKGLMESLNPVSLCSQLLTNKSSFNLLTLKYLLVNILTNRSSFS